MVKPVMSDLRLSRRRFLQTVAAVSAVAVLPALPSVGVLPRQNIQHVWVNDNEALEAQLFDQPVVLHLGDDCLIKNCVFMQGVRFTSIRAGHAYRLHFIYNTVFTTSKGFDRMIVPGCLYDAYFGYGLVWNTDRADPKEVNHELQTSIIACMGKVASQRHDDYVKGSASSK